MVKKVRLDFGKYFVSLPALKFLVIDTIHFPPAAAHLNKHSKVIKINKLYEGSNMLYSISLYLHIIGAMVLFFAVGIEWLCLSNLRASETREGICAWINHFSILKKLFMTAFFLLLIPGIYMMAYAGYNGAWVIFGIIGLLSLSISGSVLSGKRIMGIGKSAKQSETESPLSELLHRVKDEYLWNSFMIRLFSALGIVFLMTFKTDLVDSIVVLVAAISSGYIMGKLSKSPAVLEKAEAEAEA